MYSNNEQVLHPPPQWAVEAKPVLGKDAPTVASVYSGGGFWEVGAMSAGFRPVWGN